MVDETATALKPPPLHDRCDVFEDIAALYNGGNNLLAVQDTFRGALSLLEGTAIPKGHDALVSSIEGSAKLIELADDPIVTATIAWVEAEKLRHAPKGAHQQVGNIGLAHRPANG